MAQKPAANRLTLLKWTSRSTNHSDCAGQHLVQHAAEDGADQADHEGCPEVSEQPPPQHEVAEDGRRQTDREVGEADGDVLEHGFQLLNVTLIEPRYSGSLNCS